jgi:hypothetical protein
MNMNELKYGWRHNAGSLCLLCIAALFFSCCRKDKKPPLKTRTVIVYMVGDNNLNSYVSEDINEMERGWKDAFDGDLIVYVDQKDATPYILKISSDRTNSIVSKEVMKYSEQNSSSPKVMERVLADIKSMYPAKSYGLILWSHASGWLPAPSRTRAFGDDDGESMDITELAGLSGKYDFIVFDACDMMGVEAAYELRNNADYIIASVTEVLAGGFPYDNILEHLFAENADLAEVCREFMKLYSSYGAISAVKTGNLDNLAAISRTLIQRYKSRIEGFDVSQIQKYDANDITLFFDFLDFMENIADNNSDLQTLRNQLEQTVIFEDHTSSILTLDEESNSVIIDITRSCGLNCYIPGQHPYIDEAYKTTSWYKEVYR